MGGSKTKSCPRPRRRPTHRIGGLRSTRHRSYGRRMGSSPHPTRFVTQGPRTGRCIRTQCARHARVGTTRHSFVLCGATLRLGNGFEECVSSGHPFAMSVSLFWTSPLSHLPISLPVVHCELDMALILWQTGGSGRPTRARGLTMGRQGMTRHLATTQTSFRSTSQRSRC